MSLDGLLGLGGG